jgi:hypothetical protein
MKCGSDSSDIPYDFFSFSFDYEDAGYEESSLIKVHNFFLLRMKIT